MRNHYKVLGIPVSATEAEIKQAYRRMAALHHPDHNPHDPLAMHEMKAINEAYDVLSDPEKRTQYDRLNGVPGSPAAATSHGSSSGAAGSQYDYHPTAASPTRHDPSGTRVDRTPPDAENSTDILWAMQDQDRNSITQFMKSLLWADVFISVAFLIYYFLVRSDLPVMPRDIYMYSRKGASWMTHLKVAAYLELAASVAAIYWTKRTARSHFLDRYLAVKCLLFISVAAAFFGMTTTENSVFLPTIVLLWKGFLIVSLFISRLEQSLWRSP